MNWCKKLEVFIVYWIVLFVYPANGDNTSSLMEIGNELAHHYFGKPTNGQSLVEEYIQIEIQASGVILSTWESPLEERYNRSGNINDSKTELDRLPLLKYYLTGVQIFFLRLFSGESQAEVTAQKNSFKGQVKALQDKHKKDNHSLKSWMQFLTRQIKYQFYSRDKIMREKSSPKPKILSRHTSVRPKYYDIMTKQSNVNTENNNDVEHRSETENSMYSIYQKAFIFALIDEPRVIRFYIQEIVRFSAMLMNHTHYLM